MSQSTTDQITKIENALSYHLRRSVPRHSVIDIYEYAVLPPGKAFRPLLVWAITQDFTKQSLFQNSLKDFNSAPHLLACAVEFHHDYTLVHDDLPCMDDDDLRRGKASTHIKFGQWQALLTGDGLLNLSYQLLFNLNNVNAHLVGKIFSKALGPKGLIHGQVLDLSHEMTESFEKLIETHTLKTARLIQTSLVCAYLLTPNSKASLAKELWRFGEAMGMAFQLLDDLTELEDSSLSTHESEVNPWLESHKQCSKELLRCLKVISNYFIRNESVALKEVIKVYFLKINKVIQTNSKTIEKHTEAKLAPIMSLLNLIN